MFLSLKNLQDFEDQMTAFSSLSFHPLSQIIHVYLSHILWEDSFVNAIDATSATKPMEMCMENLKIQMGLSS